MPMSIPRSQSSGTFGWRLGGQRRFLASRSSRVASTYAMSAEANGSSPIRIDCRVIRPAVKMGVSGAGFRPSAAQCTWRCPGLVGIVPPSRTMRSDSMRRTLPSRTTPSMRRSCSISPELMRRAPEHRRLRRVGRRGGAARDRFEPREQIADRRRLGGGLELQREALEHGADELAALQIPAVDEPALARLDPADVGRRHAAIEEPGARVERRLARADDDVARRPLANVREGADRYAACSGGDLERRRRTRRHATLEVGRIDKLLAYLDLDLLAGDEPRRTGARRGSSTSESSGPDPKAAGAPA